MALVINNGRSAGMSGASALETLWRFGTTTPVADTGALIEELYGVEAREQFAGDVTRAANRAGVRKPFILYVAARTGAGDARQGNTTIAERYWRPAMRLENTIYDGATMRRTTERDGLMDYATKTVVEEAEATADALDRQADRTNSPAARQMGRQLAKQLRQTAMLAKRNAASIVDLQTALGGVQSLASGADASARSIMQKLGPQGPEVYGTDNREGYVARYSDAMPFRGGIIQTDPTTASFTQGVTAQGQFRAVGFAPNPLARLRQTEACSVWADIQGPGAAQAEQQAGALSVSFTVNGVQVSQMNQIPLSVMLQTLNGTPNKIGLSHVIEPADLPEFELRVVNQIDVPAGAWFVQFYVDSGRACRQSW